MKLQDLGEFQLIERIRQRATNRAGVCRGIGDDAAVLNLPEGHHLLTSTDMLIEGIHFRHDWTNCKDLGHKAVAVNLSDIAAMGGSPRFLYLGLACPGEADLDEITAFLEGALEEADRFDVALVGGDTCRSPGPWIISVTVEGSAKAGQEIGRNGAAPGDVIMVSGTLGDSALALRMLSSGQTLPAELSQRHHRPIARVELGRRLGQQQLATAMIDISDGLAGDLEHILQASGVDGLVMEDSIPRSQTFQEQVKIDPEHNDLPLYGGEDYELLFTVAPENAARVVALSTEVGLPVTQIGVIQQGAGILRLQDKTGEVRPILVKSYDHFCRP